MRASRQFSATDLLPFIAAPAGENAIELAGLEIDVVVTGLYAETTQTMRFYNPNQRDLEGNLTFPLPDGAVVCGYALDVDGIMVDGVVVAKKEARRILEAEERKGVDPGLVEQVQGNVYRTRIYPLPALGMRTIKLVYISELTVADNDAAYHVPLSHAGHIGDVSLRVEIAQAPVEPRLSGGIGNLSLTRWNQSWVAEAKLGQGIPAEDLHIRLPVLPDHIAVVETVDDDAFFSISSRMRALDNRQPWVPKRIALCWDASGSRADVSRDLAMLEALLGAWPRVVVDVVVLRDAAEADVGSFAADEATDALLDYLRALPYDGGTNLGDFDFHQLPHQDVEAWLLCSDGMNTVGTGLPRGSVRPVFAVSGVAHSNSTYLQHIASESGGAYFNLLRQSPEAAAEAIASWRTALHLECAAGCEDIHVSTSGGRFVVTGRLVEEVGSVQLSGPGAPDDHVAIGKRAARPGHAVARAWAGLHAQALALQGPSTAADVAQLGRKYGLVTPGTSLLVLESLEQYIEYDIEPPESLPEMRADFHRHRRKVADDGDRSRKQHIESVLRMWRERIAWWETDFAGQRARRLADAKAARLSARRARPAGRYEDEDASDQLRASMMSVDMADARLTPMGAPMSAPASMPPMAAAPPAPAADAPSERMAEMASFAEMDEEAAFDADDLAAPMMSTFGRMALEEQGDAPEPELRKAGKRDATAAARVSIKPWSPDTPYLGVIKAAEVADAYDAYLGQRPEYARSPAFFLDCADYFLSAGQRELGLRVLSNIVELAIDDAALLRMYAWRLQQAGELDAAIAVFERVRADRDDEPQSHRDLALALGLRWQRDGNAADVTRAIDLLYQVITQPWERFPEIELIALMEMNRLVYFARQARIKVADDIDARLIRRMDLDVRISMSWDADLTDVDLHVFEPTGEHAYYGHNRTEIGGLVSRDFTQGYGPEEYVLRRAAPGTYTVKAHYYGSHQQTLTGACTVIVNVFTNYARADEARQVLTLRLERASDQVLVGEIAIDGGSGNEGGDGGGEDLDAWQARFAKLVRGMNVDEVIAAVGQPAEIRDEVETVLEYRARDADGEEQVIQVVFAPTLTAVRRIMDGACLDLV